MKQTVTTSKTLMKVLFIMSVLICCVSKVHAQRDPFQWPFTSTSIWNMPIGSNAVYQPAGFKKVTDFDNVAPYYQGGIAIDDEPIILSKSSDPLMTIYNITDWSYRCNTTSTSGKQIHFPANLHYADPNGSQNTPNYSGAVVQPDGSLWHFNAIATCSADKIVAYDYTSAENNTLTSTGYEGGHGGSGLSGIGGSIRLGELLASTPIRHAIKLNVLASRYLVYNNDGTPGYRWPANRADGYANPASDASFGYGTSNTNNFTYMEMGALVAILPSATPQSLGITNPIAIKIFHALQDYGAYIVDDTHWNHYDIPLQDGVVDEVLSATGTDMRNSGPQTAYYQDMFKIITALYAVTNNSPTAIGGGGTPRQPLAPDFAQVAVTGVSVNPTAVSKEVGSQQTLIASVLPADASNKNISWSSGNTAVATVNSAGVVNAVAVGSATITVTTADGSKSATCVVTVTAAVPTIKLTGTVIGTPGSYGDDPTVTNDKAMDGDLTTFFDAAQPDGNWVGLDLGSPKILMLVKYCPRATWASRLIGGKIEGSNVADFSTATDLFTITEVPTENVLTSAAITNTTAFRYVRYLSPNGGYGNIAEIEFRRSAVNVSVTGITMSPITAGVAVGGTTSLTATIDPIDATEQTVSWTSGNTAVATVSKTGVVSGVAVGTAIITVTTQDGNKTATCTVTVTPKIAVTGVTVSPAAISIGAGATTPLTFAVAPATATNKSVTFTSSNTAVATVDSTGLVTGKAAGKDTITVTTLDGNFTSIAVITVTAVKTTSFKIMPLGDSKVEGSDGSGHFSWRGYLRAKLMKDGYTIDYVGPRANTAPGDGVPNDLDHAGFGGYTIGPDTQTFCGTCETTGVFEHIQDYFVANDPDVVLLALGINDFFNGDVHPANYSTTAPQRYQDLVNKILQLKPSVKIIVGTIDPVKWDQSWGGDPSDNDLGALNAKIKAIADASATDNIYFADIRNKFLTTFSADDFYDDIHFSEQGAVKTANSWYDAVIPVLGGSQPVNVAVTGVSLSPVTASVSVGATTSLTATLAPANATNKNVSWSSSNTAVATVSAAGVVSGVAKGAATITVTTTDGSKTATAAVTVTGGGGTTLTIGQTDVLSGQDGGSSTYLNAQIATLSQTATLQSISIYVKAAAGQMYMGVYNDNAGKPGSLVATTAQFTPVAGWNTINVTTPVSLAAGTYWLSFQPDNDGLGQAVSTTSGTTYYAQPRTYGALPGSFPAATLAANVESSVYATFTRGTVSVTCVTMSSTTVSVVVGATSQLTATVAPANATNKNVSWSSSNTAVATVSAAGVVSGLAQGAATITVTTTDGSKTATAAVTVIANDGINLALNKPGTASAIEGAGLEAAKAFDGDATTTRWSSGDATPTAWIYVDLGATYNITKVVLTWEAAYATAYQIQTSDDGITWKDIFATTTGDGATDALTGLMGCGRYVRMNGTARGSAYGYSLYEFAVYGTASHTVAVTGVSVNLPLPVVVSGNTIQLTAVVAPVNASNKIITWSSSDVAVATVDGNGLVTAKAAGTATITATTQDNNKIATSVITVTSPLPVNFVSFSVTLDNTKVKLTWTTASEINSKNFKVQRSIDGSNFETIMALPAAGNTSTLRNYSYDDVEAIHLKRKQLYYRIQETDIDDRILSTEVKSVQMPAVKNLFALVYNPVREEALLKYECSENGKVMIRIMDNMGRIISLIEKAVTPGVNQFKLETGKLAGGIYEIKLDGKNDHLHVRMMKD